jgi:hypothetical protein
LLWYGVRPPFARAGIERIAEARIVNHRPTPTPDRQTRRTRTPLAFISRLAALIPAPRRHRHRDDGVLAPHAGPCLAVIALACGGLGERRGGYPRQRAGRH